MPGFKTNYKENNKERVANNVTPINKGKKE
jgi:hypothetical protein